MLVIHSNHDKLTMPIPYPYILLKINNKTTTQYWHT